MFRIICDATRLTARERAMSRAVRVFPSANCLARALAATGAGELVDGQPLLQERILPTS